MKATIALLTVTVGLTGCMSLSGYDAKSKFSCKAPDGIMCESMSGVYANTQARNLPGQKVGQGTAKSAEKVSHAKVEGVLSKPITSGTPIRSNPRVLRLWIAPWEDSDGDLHDQSYIWLTVNNGKWLIEHNQRRIQDSFKPVRAPAHATPDAAKDEAKPESKTQSGASQASAAIADMMNIGKQEEQ